MDKTSIGQWYPHQVQPVTTRKATVAPNEWAHPKTTFDNILQEKIVRISQHAGARLSQRGIELLPDDMAKIQTAIDKAAAKGAKDSLFLMKDMAFIVNVKNRTIITAMDSASMKDNVFTQIDSAMIIS